MATTTTHPSLLISLADVARLARVQRPVVSMWRSRSASTGTPFPAPVERAGAQERFDADQVVSWLELTGRGNNPDVRADVAAFTSLTGVSSLGDIVATRAVVCVGAVVGRAIYEGRLDLGEALRLCEAV